MREPAAAPQLCVFVSAEAGKPAYFDRLVAVASTWASAAWPAHTSLHYVLSAHGLKHLFNRSRVERAAARLRARSDAQLARLGVVDLPEPPRRRWIRNEQLAVFDAESRDVFRLGRAGAVQRIEWQLTMIRERFAARCDWSLLTEDDAYVDVAAVRAVVEARLLGRGRSHHYVGKVYGQRWGDFVHGDFILFDRSGLEFAADSLGRCAEVLGERRGPEGWLSGHWLDSYLGGCIRLAAGWPGLSRDAR